MERQSETQKRNQIWRLLSDRLSGIKISSIWHAIGRVFTKCTKEQPVSSVETGHEDVKTSADGYLTNVELLEKLTKLENQFKHQNDVLEKHGLRKIQVSSVPTKQAKSYHGGIEPNIKQDTLAVLMTKIKPDRYDDERFEELDHLMQKFMLNRAKRGKRQGSNASRPVRKEGLYICGSTEKT